MKVLIIDNTRDLDSWGSEDLKSFVLRSKDRTAFVRRAPESDLPKNLKGYDRLILSGSRTSCFDSSPWTQRLDELLKEALNENKPTLGVCYGHQALNRVLGGSPVLRKGAKGEFGWTEVEVLQPSPLFEGLPSRFWSFSSHFEEVAQLPKGMRLLARSQDCEIQACQFEDRPIYGIQFHPEKSLTSTEATIAGWKKELARGECSRTLSHPEKSRKLFDASVGEKIFENFLGR